MKIVHVCSSSMSFRSFLREHLINLANEGHSVTALCGDFDRKEAEFFGEHGVDFVCVPIKRKISFLSDFLTLVRLLLFFIKLRPDVVHTHTPKASLLGTFAARVLRVRNVFFHCHGLNYIRYNQVTSKIGFFLERLPIKFAHRTLAVSPSLASFLTESGYSFCKKIIVLGSGSICGVDVSLFSPPYKSRSDLKPSSEALVVGYLGRVNKDKGVDEFVETVSKLRKLGLNVVGRIAGILDGDVASHFPPYVSLMGELSRDEASVFLKSCDIFLFPSHREGFGLAVAEASATGLPVVAFNIIGVRDVVSDSETGFLIRPGDIDEMTDKVKLLIKSSELRHEIGVRGRERINKHYRQDIVLDDFISFYREVV